MRNPLLLPLALLLVVSCARPTPAPVSTHEAVPAPVIVPAGTPTPDFALPWFIPAGAADEPPPAERGDDAPAEIVPCLTEATGGPACKIALAKIAATGTGESHTIEVYRRACDAGEKLLGCGIFQSTAITEEDDPILRRLMLCEHGWYEGCEDVKTRAAPLLAWLSTLKKIGCKRGANALCPDFHQCKAPERWTCHAQPGGPKVCGCAAPCSGTLTSIAHTSKRWPDGSHRGQLGCAASAPR